MFGGIYHTFAIDVRYRCFWLFRWHVSLKRYLNIQFAYFKYLICCYIIQSLSCDYSLRPILCDLMDCSMPGFPVLHYLPEFVQIHVYWANDAIQPPHFLLPPSPSALNLSPASGSFPMRHLCIRWPKYWSFSFSISSSKEYSGLISSRIDWFFSFRIDWFVLFAVQHTLKSLLLYHNYFFATLFIFLIEG